MDIFLHEDAEKFLNRLDDKTKSNIKKRLKDFSEDPYSKKLDIKKLKGLKGKPDIFRLRVGKYRIIYFVQEGRILVTEIMKREKGYDYF